MSCFIYIDMDSLANEIMTSRHGENNLTVHEER